MTLQPSCAKVSIRHYQTVRFGGCGGVPEWLNGPVSKTGIGVAPYRGFESLLLRQHTLQAGCLARKIFLQSSPHTGVSEFKISHGYGSARSYHRRGANSSGSVRPQCRAGQRGSFQPRAAQWPAGPPVTYGDPHVNSLQLRAGFSGFDRVEPRHLLNWNRRYRFSKAYLVADNDPVLESDLRLEGVTPEAIHAFVRDFGDQATLFFSYLRMIDAGLVE